MAPFRFRLAGVLRIWQRREDAALTVLQREMALAAAARGEVERLRRVRDEAAHGAAGALSDGRERHDPAWHRNWMIHLATKVEAAVQHVARCDVREAAARLAWQRARRDRRVIERLRDRAGQRHAAENRRLELVAMDERAGVRAQKEQAW